MRMLIAAIEQARHVKGGDIAGALEAVRIDDGGTPAYYRQWDHQMLRKTLVLKVKDKITDPWDWLDVVATAPGNSAQLDALYGTPQEIGCRMEPR
ncbi:MAG: hypothetical protein GAK30_00980 [Paracidovorax wautersii]|uniref:Uncharacterized protein n=1 Tax=Paracidovorax wautersii TaxID=1177982 RepID=A0A7V8JRD2_9BURK|nr:MAG: hypothetical protein GAK30_00980 [Paracidovorax wautersii]